MGTVKVDGVGPYGSQNLWGAQSGELGASFSSGYKSQGQRLLRCPPGQPPDFTEDPKGPRTQFQTSLQHLLHSLSCVVGVPVPGRLRAWGTGCRDGSGLKACKGRSGCR